MAETAGGRQLVGDIERGFAENRLAVIETVLHGEPDRIGPTRNIVGIGKIIQPVTLFDVMGLILHEETRQETEALVLWRGNANFVAALSIRVDVRPKLTHLAG